MRICMVVHDAQEFGGLEEYATTLAVGLQQAGHQVSVLSTTCVSPDNQYQRRLRQNGVTVVQVPKWLSQPASHWPTKERILVALMWIASPLVYLLAIGLLFIRRCSWGQALTSTRGWLRGQLLSRLVAPDRYKPLARLLLNWWRWHWRPELLHIQGYTTNLLFAIDWAHARVVPVVYEEHQTPDAQFDWRQGFQHSINRADIIVPVSGTSAQALRAVCGVIQPIVVRSPLLPDPIASDWCKNDRPRQSDEPVNLTTVARLSVAKGLTYLLEAIAQVRVTHPSAQFRVYGDGPMRQQLLDCADQLGLDGNAIFVGPFTTREELSSIMAQTEWEPLLSANQALPRVAKPSALHAVTAI